ncbi:MAG TPA: 50S ribosomal protein L6 [Atribacteraceae bacterium]|nr:50S ribosomal protein L6 [Atribacteraceae bacterium]
MSRIGRKVISIPQGVTVEMQDNWIKVRGARGALEQNLHPRMKVVHRENEITVVPTGTTKLDRSLHGLTRTLIANMIDGVTNGFEKALEINGLGYKVQKKGEGLILNLGFTHPVDIPPQEGISFEVEGQILKVKGIDKQQVGQTAAKIRILRKTEPYTGTGIRYLNEVIRRKQGKTTAK